MDCPKCGQKIHPQRLEMGFKTCVNCSSEKKYGYIHVFEGKTANTIQVIKDPDKAAELQWKQNRRNYGVANGMYKQNKGKKND